MKRNNSRIKALVALYHYDLMEEKIDEEYLEDVINEVAEVEVDEDFYNKLVNGVIDNLREINKIINLNLNKWTIDRMSYIDRNLIRIAIYEMLYTATPRPIIINEILNLTHIYSETTDETESKFNNKLLDEIGKYIDGKKVSNSNSPK